MNVALKNRRDPYVFEELNKTQAKQLAACGRLWDGKKWPAKKRLREVDEPEEGNFHGEGLQIWDVYVDGKHTHDLWIYMVDSGAVFDKGTTKVALSCIQFDWSGGGGDPALAVAIGAAYESPGKKYKFVEKASASDAPRWSKLKHARGNARTIPSLMANAVKGDEDALDALDDALLDGAWHGAQRKVLYSASGPALTLLLETWNNKKAKFRYSTIEMALTMLQRGERQTLLARGRDPEDPSLGRRYPGPDGRALLAAAAAGVPIVTSSFLADRDPDVRELAAMYLGFVPEHAEASWPILRTCAEKDKAAQVRVRAIFAIGYLARACETIRKEAAKWLSSMKRGALEKGAALIAGWLVGGRVTKAKAAHRPLVAFLCATLPFEAPSEQRGIAERDIDQQALTILGGAVLGDAGRAAAQKAIIAALTEIPPSAGERDTWTSCLIEWHLPMRKGAYETIRRNPTDPKTLPPATKKWLAALHAVPHGGHWPPHGFPPDVRSRRRVLGYDKKTVLEDVILCPRFDKKKKLPRHFATREAFHRMDTGRDARKYVEEKYFDDLDDQAWLELCTEVEARSYDLGGSMDPEILKAAVLAVSKTERKRWRKQYLAECRQPYNDRLHEDIGWLLAWSELHDLGPKAKLPASYDDVVHFYGPIDEVKAILERIPAARRNKIADDRILRLAGNRYRADKRLRALKKLLPKTKTALKKRFG